MQKEGSSLPALTSINLLRLQISDTPGEDILSPRSSQIANIMLGPNFATCRAASIFVLVEQGQAHH